jgi:hypothetical protein
MYPSIMKSKHFRVPIKEGTIKTLSQEEFQAMREKFFEYGIYRVKIHFENKHRKIMRMNKNNYYTTMDLNTAKRLGLKMTVVEDGQPNFLHYGAGTCVSGSQIFSNFVDYLYNLRKTTGDKTYKNIANKLWGALSEHNFKTVRYDMKKDFDFTFTEDDIILKEGFTGLGSKYRIDYVKKDRIFKYNWARVKVFMIAKGRELISKLIEKNFDHIHRVNTDGFLSDVPLDVDVGSEMGKLRYDGQRNVIVSGVNSIIDVNNIYDWPKLKRYYEKKFKQIDEEIIYYRKKFDC